MQILSNDFRRWSKATGLISATICSVLEAGWKPVIPGFGKHQKLTRFWMARLPIKRRLSTISQETSNCKCGEKASEHASSISMEKGIITDFARKAGAQVHQGR